MEKDKKTKTVKTHQQTTTGNSFSCQSLGLWVVIMLVMIMVILCTLMCFRLKARRFLSPCDCWVWLQAHSNPELHTRLKVGWMDDSFSQPCYPSIRLCSIYEQDVPSFLSETNQEMICSVFSIAGPLPRCRAGGVAEQGNESACLSEALLFFRAL